MRKKCWNLDSPSPLAEETTTTTTTTMSSTLTILGTPIVQNILLPYQLFYFIFTLVFFQKKVQSQSSRNWDLRNEFLIIKNTAALVFARTPEIRLFLDPLWNSFRSNLRKKLISDKSVGIGRKKFPPHFRTFGLSDEPTIHQEFVRLASSNFFSGYFELL